MSEERDLILIVDDSPINLKIIGGILEKAGYKTAFALNGNECLNFVSKKLPDLILLDVMMPEMDGYLVCQKLKEMPIVQDVPVIFLTALDSQEDKLKGFEAGGVDYVPKPFFAQEVLARINVHIILKKTMKKLEELSITDELTKTYNRRFSFEIIKKMMLEAKRYDNNFCLCFIDVDNLKKTNDTFGHNYGDELILTIVNSLKERLRTTDYLCRMGGDEFIILLPKCTKEMTEEIIIKVKDSIKEIAKSKLFPIDFSYGTFYYDSKCDLSPDELLHVADELMYEQKKEKKAVRE